MARTEDEDDLLSTYHERCAEMASRASQCYVNASAPALRKCFSASRLAIAVEEMDEVEDVPARPNAYAARSRPRPSLNRPIHVA
jgi:hypothetical protein